MNGALSAGWQYCGVPYSLHPPAAARALPLTWVRAPRRAAAALGLAAAVLMLHALLLGGLPSPPGPSRPGAPPRALQVRQLAAQVGKTAAAPTAAPPAARTAAAAPTQPRTAAARKPAAATPSSTDNDDAANPAAAAPPSDGTVLPVYATRLPPASTLQYTVQRPGPGRPGIQAELRWRPTGDTYTLTLGFAVTGWASVGALDLHGIAPERHVETRRGRELRATNFQRDSARITFSGPQTEYPLLPGAQDRLSWMLQLAGVLAADPALGEAGREVALFVAGVRGDAAVWTFTASGPESLELPSGTLASVVHLHREPQRPYDTRVDIWLDPARHHLPVRLRMQTRADGEGTDFLLATMSQP